MQNTPRIEYDPLNESHFGLLLSKAELYAASAIVPQHFQDHPEDVFVALEIACRSGLQEFTVLQNIAVIHGKPSFQAQLAIALLRSSGMIAGPIKYSYAGKSLETSSCTASVIDSHSGEVVEHTLKYETAIKEGWVAKAGSKWKTDPKLMLSYRAISQLIRLHYPEVLFGMLSVEEAAEVAQRNPETMDTAEFFAESRSERQGINEQVADVLATQIEEEPIVQDDREALDLFDKGGEVAD